jgi:hypothetical protein
LIVDFSALLDMRRRHPRDLPVDLTPPLIVDFSALLDMRRRHPRDLPVVS